MVKPYCSHFRIITAFFSVVQIYQILTAQISECFFSGIQASKITAEVVPCTILSMSFFDRLYGNVVRESGYLHKCFDEFCGDFTISDELRKVHVIKTL